MLKHQWAYFPILHVPQRPLLADNTKQKLCPYRLPIIVPADDVPKIWHRAWGEDKGIVNGCLTQESSRCSHHEVIWAAAAVAISIVIWSQTENTSKDAWLTFYVNHSRYIRSIPQYQTVSFKTHAYHGRITDRFNWTMRISDKQF